MLKALDNYDWAEVFGEGGGGNCDKKTDSVPPGTTVDCTPPTRDDVVRIVSMVLGENDGPAWVGVFELRDGRYLVAEGSCDYTGWDCQAGNSLTVAASQADAIRYGLSQEQRDRLNINLPDLDAPITNTANDK